MLTVTDVSTTCAVVIFRVSYSSDVTCVTDVVVSKSFALSSK